MNSNHKQDEAETKRTRQKEKGKKIKKKKDIKKANDGPTLS